MDTHAIGDLVDKVKAMPIDSMEGQDEYDDVDEEEEHEPITLGFVDKPKNKWSLQRQYFPSKAGGVPVLYLFHWIRLHFTSILLYLMYKESVCFWRVYDLLLREQQAWLDPLNIPSGESFVCDICGDPLQFLLQVWS